MNTCGLAAKSFPNHSLLAFYPGNTPVLALNVVMFSSLKNGVVSFSAPAKFGSMYLPRAAGRRLN